MKTPCEDTEHGMAWHLVDEDPEASMFTKLSTSEIDRLRIVLISRKAAGWRACAALEHRHVVSIVATNPLHLSFTLSTSCATILQL